MKVLHVLVNYHPSIGGIQTLYKGVSENLTEKFKDEVEVFTVNSYYGPHSKQFKKINTKSEIINGVFVTRFPFIKKHKGIFSLANKVYSKLFLKPSKKLHEYIVGPWSPSLKKAISCTDADIISASSLGFSYMQYPLYRKELKNPKPFAFLGAIHFGFEKNYNPVTSKMLAAIKASDVCICITSFEKNKLIDMGVNENKIVVIGAGVDIESFDIRNKNTIRKQLDLNDDDILIAYVGRLEETKNIKFLLDSFLLAFNKNNKIKLLLAGYESQYMSKLKGSINNLEEKYRNSIFFKHNLTSNEKIEIFNGLDIFVLPSYNESFGIVFLEAWCCKKPVIGINIGAIASVITDNVDGFLVDYSNSQNNQNNLAKKILELASDADLRNTLGINGYNKTKENFTWPIVTHKFREAYLMAIKNFNNV